jgi:hypothetical protein
MAPRVKITGEYGYQRNKKTTLKHLIRGVAGFLFVVVGTSAVTTQYMARNLNYAAALGEPYILFGRVFCSSSADIATFALNSGLYFFLIESLLLPWELFYQN